MDDAASLAGKRILFYLAGLELGGAERQALHLARHLKGLGCDVFVWAVSGPGLAAEMCGAAGIPWAIQPSVWPCRKRHWPRACFRLLAIRRAMRRAKPDIVMAYCERPCASAGLALRRDPRPKFLWCQRDCYLKGGALERAAYRRATAVICNAQHIVDFLRQTFGDSAAPVHVAHNGLELDLPRKTRGEWRAELGIPDSAIAAVMLANFRFQKDHATLLRAWRRIADQQAGASLHPVLVLAGARQESFPETRRLAQDLGLLDSVRFPGQISDVSGLLAAMDIGVLSSPREGLSNSVLEYMASGLPVASTDLPANREALGDDPRHPYFCPGDAESLAARLFDLIENQDLRRELGSLNRKRAKAEFAISAMCEKTTAILSRLASNGALPIR